MTRDVLAQVCDKVDLVEPVLPFADQIEVELSRANVLDKLGTIYRVGMQDFYPEKKSYWFIWCQWCVGQLKDEDLVKFLMRCAEAVVDGGLIFVKVSPNATSKSIFQIKN